MGKHPCSSQRSCVQGFKQCQHMHGIDYNCTDPSFACREDAECPSTCTKHSCAKAGACAKGSAGAPESQGSCYRDGPDGAGHCRKLPLTSPHTHVFDVAAKQWLLPFVAVTSDEHLKCGRSSTGCGPTRPETAQASPTRCRCLTSWSKRDKRDEVNIYISFIYCSWTHTVQSR